MTAKIYALASLFVMMTACHSNAQEEIEKYLVDQKLVSVTEFKKYKDKEKADDEYVRLMIREMKKGKGGGEYVRKMEREYKEELKLRRQNKDTLQVLSLILEVSRPKRDFYGFTDKDAANPDLRTALIAYVNQLRTKQCITETNAESLLKLIEKKNLYDSCSIVDQARGYRDKSRQTAQPELTALMGQLKEQGILSEKNYRKLLDEPFPDSVNKIRHIVSLCERTFLPAGNSSFIQNKKDLFSRIEALAKLAGIEISGIKNDLIALQSDTTIYRAIPAISLIYNGKTFSHACYEVSTTDTDRTDLYGLTGQDYYKVINRVLAYIRSPYRIYEIGENNPLSYTDTYWKGFIMLTNEQRSSLYEVKNIEVSSEDHVEQLEEKDIIKAIELYKKTGLLKSISQSSTDSVILSIKQDPVYRYNELISRLPAISVTIQERLPLTKAEAIVLLNRMAAISNYAFNPTNIRFENKAGKRSVLLFEEKGITRQQEFSSYIGWDGIWHLIHDCVFTDPNRKGQFEVLRIEQDKVAYVYVMHGLLDQLEKEKVINDY